MNAVRLYKNWAAIRQLQNWRFMMLVAYTSEDEPEILTGLQRGFPELFSSKPVSPRVPYRLIELYYGDDAEGQYDALHSWLDACQCMGIPIAHHWVSLRDTPQEVIDQVRAFEATGNFWTGSLLTFQGRRYIAITNGAGMYSKYPNSQDAREEETIFDVRDLAVIERSCVIFSGHHRTFPRRSTPPDPMRELRREAFYRALATDQ